MDRSQPKHSPPAKRRSAERIAKVIARAGLCSRREAEQWIRDGRVALNGAAISTPALTVSGTDHIVVDGSPLPRAQQTRLWRYHKPAGQITTTRDQKNRPTVFDQLPPTLPRVVKIGRLDFNTEGLLLLTNDGELAAHLEQPGWMRCYRVRVHGRIDEGRLTTLQNGMVIEGVRYGPVQADLERQQSTNAWLTVSLREGKNREIRRLFSALGWPVNRLIRTDYGPFHLGDLRPGAVEETPQAQIRALLNLDQEAPPKGQAPRIRRRKRPAPKRP